MKAAEVLDAIERKYSQCAIVREVQINDPESDKFSEADAWVAGGRVGPMPALVPAARRIDALMLDGGSTRTAIEVKISRADFFRDTPEKRRPWQKITNRFIYATPSGLITPEEVPDGCGLWEIDDGKVHVTKRARVNKDAEPIPHQVLVAFAYRLKRTVREQVPA